MKKVLFLIALLICCASLYAQADRESLSLIRVNGTYTLMTNGSKGVFPDNRKIGYSIELGGKTFFNKRMGFYLEGGAQFFYTKLPYNRAAYAAFSANGKTIRNSRIPYSGRLSETGIGVKVIGGYDFVLSKKISLELFAGPVVNYTIHFGPGKGSHKKKYLNKFNYRLQVGAGLNYRRFNLSFAYSNDLFDRGKTYDHHIYKYRTYAFSVGLAYRFPLFKQINY